ncbi:MAG: hypothetical protein KKH51_01545 [Actinobacteria bacterium]|nr:hypothetical protein [Actinomycetota bacterium]
MTARNVLVGRVLAGAAIVAALAGSAVLVAGAPDNEDITAPFLLQGRIGDTVSGRSLTAVVEGVRLTRYLDVKYKDAGDTSTRGVWVVVDTVLTARRGTLILSDAELWIDDVRYGVSDILPAPTPLQLSYGPDVPQRGSLVFEIPEAALASPGAAHATVAFLTTSDPRLDSFPVVVVDLTGLTVTDRERIDERAVVDQ